MLAVEKCYISTANEKSEMFIIPKKIHNIKTEAILLPHCFSIMKTGRAASVVF